LGSIGSSLRGLREFPVCDESIQGQVYLYPSKATIGDRRSKILWGKVLCIAAGMKVSISEINGIGPTLYGGDQGLRRPCWS
jgi:hypothetical protein